MKVRVSAIIVDNSLSNPQPTHVAFDHLGNWYEALDQLVHEYASQYRGGMRNVDADRLELIACSLMNIEDVSPT